MTQAVLDFSAPVCDAPAVTPAPAKPWRLMRATARHAWYVVRDRLPLRERAVYYGLMAYWNGRQHWPTAQELLEFLLVLKGRHPRHPRYRVIHDINNVRPRLHGLNHYDPALVVTGPTRLCQSARAREARALLKTQTPKLEVFTWRIPQLGEAARAGRGDALGR